jgi:hypothetical protein
LGAGATADFEEVGGLGECKVAVEDGCEGAGLAVEAALFFGGIAVEVAGVGHEGGL